MELKANTSMDVTELLSEAEYVADDETATALFLADKLNRPLLVEGQPGSGKTELAKAVSRATGADLERLQCYRGLKAENTIYEWDHMKQYLRIRAEGETRDEVSPDEVEESIFDERYLLDRPILRAVRNGERTVLVIDELDRANEDFEAFLLEVLDDFQVTIPELGTVTAEEPPLVIITSNRTRKVGDALKRRCLYLYMSEPSFEKELEIVRMKVPTIDETVAKQIVEFMQTIRYQENLLRTPGISETLDWAAALSEFDQSEVTPASIQRSLSTILKEPQDVEDLSGDRIKDIAESVFE